MIPGSGLAVCWFPLKNAPQTEIIFIEKLDISDFLLSPMKKLEICTYIAILACGLNTQKEGLFLYTVKVTIESGLNG